MPKTALILIDIQNDYFAGGLWTVPEMERAAANAARLLAKARDTGELIVHIRHEFPSEAAPFFRPGSTGAEIHASVEPLSSETVITKDRPNSFQNTPLLDLLKGETIEAVTLCGAMSQMCVDATARAAADFDFAVTVVEDACAARCVSLEGRDIDASIVHAAFMAPLASSYGKVVQTEAYLEA
ncbi:MAG: cysteine hydrolase [Rhizobiales bacterium]|nr:cysteine hydrolase [Hyphomicrobiales bacterium]